MITLNDGTDVEFDSSMQCHHSINDAREAVAKQAVEFITKHSTIPVPDTDLEPPTSRGSENTSKGLELSISKKECMQELKNFLVDKKCLEAPNYNIESNLKGAKFRCTVTHSLVTEVSEWFPNKQAAKQNAAKKALIKLKHNGIY